MEIISLTPKTPQKQTIYKNEDIKTCVNGVVPLDADYTRYFMNIWDDDTISIDESFVDIDQSIEFELSLYSNNNHVVVLTGTTVGTLPINPGVTKLKYSRPKGYAVWIVDVVSGISPVPIYAAPQITTNNVRGLSSTMFAPSTPLAENCNVFIKANTEYHETSSDVLGWYKNGESAIEIMVETIAPTLITSLIMHYGTAAVNNIAYATSLKIYGSNDGQNWSEILSEQDWTITPSTNVILKTTANNSPYTIFKFVATTPYTVVVLPYITIVGVPFDELANGSSFYNVFPVISAATQGYSASMSGANVTNAYNLLTGTCEGTRTAVNTPVDFTFAIPEARSICGFRFRVGGYASYHDSRNPTWLALFGSNDGEDWTKISEYREKFKSSRYSVYTVIFPETEEYSYYKLSTYQFGNDGRSNAFYFGDFRILGKTKVGYRDFKTIIPPMANNTQGGYTASSSDESYSATYRAYDNDTSTAMGGNFGEDGKWWTQIQLPLSTVVKGFQLVASSDKAYAPTSFIFQGSEDGEEWVDIQEYSPVWSFNNEVKNYEVENTNAYTYYRWLVSSTVNGSSVRLSTIGLTTNPGDKAFKTFTDEYLTPTFISDSTASPISSDALLVPNITSGSQSGYIVTASGYISDREPWRAFNRNLSDNRWNTEITASESSACDVWLQVQLPEAKTAKYVVMNNRIDAFAIQAPVDFTIQGSNNGENWATLLSKTGVSWSVGDGKSFELNNDSDYMYYRIHITRVGPNADHCGLSYINFATADAQVYSVSATSEYDYSEGAWRVFDHTTAQWTSRVRSNVELILELPEARSCNTILLTGSNATSRSPSVFHIDGSNDKTEWTILYNQDTAAGFSASEKRVYSNADETPYKYYRLYVVSNSGDSSFMSVQELSFVNRTIIEE